VVGRLAAMEENQCQDKACLIGQSRLFSLDKEVCVENDGHQVRSRAEAMIDDLFFIPKFLALSVPSKRVHKSFKFLKHCLRDARFHNSQSICEISWHDRAR